MSIEKIEKKHVKEINKIRNHYISTTNYIFRRCEKNLDEDIDFFKFLTENNFPAIAYIEDYEVLGFAYLSPFRALDGYDQTMELSIYVKNGIFKKGIGTKLLNEIELLSKDKYHTIVSVITSDNTRSIAFHKKHGYLITGELKESGYLNGKYIDVVFMQKILSKLQ